MGSIPLLPRRLDQLPDEILIQILENVSAQRDLAATCLVNRRMNHVADPVLYKSILFCEPKHHFTFSESLVKRPRRGSVIQDIRLHYPSSELSDFIFAKQSRIDGFSDTISTMSNLESLEIHVPESLCHGIGTLFNGPFDLACLKICVSHLTSGYSCNMLINIRLVILPARRRWVLGPPRQHPYFLSPHPRNTHHHTRKTRRKRFPEY
jgi:hypothetical protein